MYCPFGKSVEDIAAESMGKDYCQKRCGHEMNAYEHNLQNCECAAFIREAERRRNEDKMAHIK